MEKFEVTWEADDGYVGGSRPHHLCIREDDLEDDWDDKQLRDYFWESVQSDFEQQVSPVSEDEEKFIEWARERIKARV